MTPRRLRGARGSVGLALALLLGPALVVAAAPPGGQDLGVAAAPWAGLASSTGADSNAGTVAGQVSVSALTLQVELSQVVVRAGKSVQVRAIVANESTASVADVRLTIRADPSGLVFRPADARVIRRIAPGRTDSITWSACGQTVGTYSLVVTAAVAGVLVASRPQQLTITAAGKAC
jgi:hypothetical protein